MKLYNYFRSSASFRVRIALNLKKLPYDYIPIHLVKNEQRAVEFLEISPDGLVPVLHDDGESLIQSLAICEYLDEKVPMPPILPADSLGRARVRALSQIIACEIHPLNNLRVLRYLTDTLGVDEAQKNAWYRHWVEDGMRAVESQILPNSAFCFGSQPTLADLTLVPQIFNAQRFNCDLSSSPKALAIYERCMQIPAFADAAPAAQPDAF